LLESKEDNDLSIDDALAFLIDAEWDDRYNKKLSRLLSQARFRYNASFAELDFSKARNIDKGKLLRFSSDDWIKKGESIIITGATGVGKSFLASAIGYQACVNTNKVMYFNSLKLFSFLLATKGDGNFVKEMNKISKQDLIIIDDFGLQVLDGFARITFLEILEDRHGLKSIIMTSQLPINKWHEVIADDTIADAICDRLIHSSHKINLKGDTMRKLRK
jgi:DNA replication protein DnaC